MAKGGWAHSRDVVPMTLRPIGRTRAIEFVGKEHRHNKRAVAGWKFGTGIFVNGELVGVGIAGRCTSRMLQTQGGGRDGHFIECTRVTTTGVPNGCSTLYSRLLRAAKALGYCRAYTYTLTTEDGASLKASGWTVDAITDEESGWDRPGRARDNDQWPEGAKVRWVQYLDECEEHPMREAA